MATITFDKLNKHIEFDVVDIEVEAQELADAIREYEDETTNMDFPKIMDGTGKDDIGGGNITAITIKLLDGWKLNAGARGSPTVFTVKNSNLITFDGSTPFFPATNVSYDRAQSTAPGLAGTIEVDVIALRKVHSNRWRILGTQLLEFDDDGTTVLNTFDLKDTGGNPTSTDVVERDPV